MGKKAQDFLESGLLNKYIIGATTPLENSEVEQYIATYTDIKEEYNLLQMQLELAAKSNAIYPSTPILASILDAINDKPIAKLPKQQKVPFWFSIAASITAIIFAGSSYVYYNQNKNLQNENNTIAEEVFDLRNDIDKNNDKLDAVMLQLIKLNNPETQKYVLRGNERAKDLKTVAYINPIDKSSLIDVVSLPELLEEQTYHMWANLQDRMVNLGILDVNDRKLKSIPYIENALSLSITIETKGDNNNNGALENTVAKILLTKDN